MLDPADALGIENGAVAVYSRAEDYLIRVIRDALKKAGESPTWAEAQLLAIRQERWRIEGMALALEKRSQDMWLQAIDEAYVRGMLAAERELASIPPSVLPTDPLFSAAAVNNKAVLAIAADGIAGMNQVHRNILRRTDDIWRQISNEAIGYSTTGSMTPYEAAKRAFTRMSRDGLGFFTDKAGRKWGLDTYAEMAVRTGTNQALRAGHTASMLEHGVDLVVVASHPNPAPMCAPYERKVLSLTGRFAPGTHRLGDRIVNVTATMAEAEGNGLHHPNCRHRHSAYIPGYTDLTEPEPDPGNEGYKATQQQRYLERQIRASKRMEEAAIDPQDVRAAKQRARNYQARLREHIEAHDLPRRRHREQLRREAKGAVGQEY